MLDELIPVIERAGGWPPNYPLIIFCAIQMLWYLERTDSIAVVEPNLRSKIIEPDMRYPETDGRWALAMLCALDGRIDEARHWFDEARRVLAR